MEKSKKIAILKNTRIFGKLKDSDYNMIAEVANLVDYSKGEIVFNEEDAADAFYIIVDGTVSIIKKSKSGEVSILAVKQSGAVFGEMAVIDELPRSAGIRAETDLSLLKILKEEFTSLINTNSNIAVELSRGICSTVRDSNNSYINNLERRNRQLEIAYRKLKEMQGELIAKEKLSLVGRFASLIVHDIKNPMTNIRAYAELIKMTVKDNPKVHKSTTVIMNEVDRLVKMTTELLEFSRGEMHLKMTPINLTSLLLNIIDSIRADLLQRGVSIVFDEKTDSVIMGDPDKLTRMFLNLINNSIEAISSSGKITLKISEENEKVKFVIQDNGCGMEPSILEKIFEPFFSHNKKKGTGLGMAIVKSIIESHKGVISSASKPGLGTRFEVVFPAL